jgi:hypothetical protein
VKCWGTGVYFTRCNSPDIEPTASFGTTKATVSEFGKPVLNRLIDTPRCNVKCMWGTAVRRTRTRPARDPHMGSTDASAQIQREPRERVWGGRGGSLCTALLPTAIFYITIIGTLWMSCFKEAALVLDCIQKRHRISSLHLSLHPPVGARIPCARARTPQFHTKNHPLREIVKKQLLSILF